MEGPPGVTWVERATSSRQTKLTTAITQGRLHLNKGYRDEYTLKRAKVLLWRITAYRGHAARYLLSEQHVPERPGPVSVQSQASLCLAIGNQSSAPIPGLIPSASCFERYLDLYLYSDVSSAGRTEGEAHLTCSTVFRYSPMASTVIGTYDVDPLFSSDVSSDAFTWCSPSSAAASFVASTRCLLILLMSGITVSRRKLATPVALLSERNVNHTKLVKWQTTTNMYPSCPSFFRSIKMRSANLEERIGVPGISLGKGAFD